MIYSINNNKVSEVHKKKRRRGLLDIISDMNSSDHALYNAYTETVERHWGNTYTGAVEQLWGANPSSDFQHHHNPTTEIEWIDEDD